MGAKVIPLGVVLHRLHILQDTTRLMAGVVISASHNPCEYNGIKFFNSDGYKLSDGIENEIESYILGEKRSKNCLLTAKSVM